MARGRKKAVDILFVNNLRTPRPTSIDVAQKLWLDVGGRPATIPVLRELALGRKTAPPAPPLLSTTAFMRSYLEAQGLSFRCIPVLEGHLEDVCDAVADGVGLVALSTTWLPTHSVVAEYVREAAAQIRSVAPDVPIVVGGVGVQKSVKLKARLELGQVSLSQEEAARHYLCLDASLDRDLDAVVVSESGEATLAAIAKRISRGEDYRNLPNLGLPKPQRYHFTERVSEPTDLDRIIDWSRYADILRGGEASVRAGVGCPFSCEFCDYHGLSAVRFRSLESLIAELKTLAAVPPPRRVMFSNDNFGVSRKRLGEVTRAMIEAKVDISWRAGMRADVIDAEVAALLRDSGCVEAILGVESGDTTVLRNMNKRLSPEKTLRAIELLDIEGVPTQSTLVVGFPGETDSSIGRTAEFLSSYPSGDNARAYHRYYMFLLDISPLSPVENPERRRAFELEGAGSVWAHSSMNVEQAKESMIHLFRQTNGPACLYPERLPTDWSLADTRRVMELRDAIQKQRMDGKDAGIDRLLAAVRDAEQDTKEGQ
jgi:p-methyltransferase